MLHKILGFLAYFLLAAAFLSSAHAATSAVGHRQEWVHVPETGRSFPVEVFLPLSTEAATEVPFAVFEFYVPRPDMPGGLWNISEAFGFNVTGAGLAEVMGGDGVRQVQDIDLGRGRGIVFLPGGNGPGFAYIPAAVELARQSGYAVFLATLPFAPGNSSGNCLRQRDSQALVSFIAGHPQYGNLEDLYGMGHSLGGQNWIARLSDHQVACGLEKETRVEGAVLLDATWEATSLAQTSSLHSPVFVISQQCRFSQMLLQIEVPSHPPRMDLEGFLVNPSTGQPPRFGAGMGANHNTLFGQGCLMNEAIVAAGGPFAPEPGATLCRLPETEGLERRSMGVTRDYSEAFINHLSKGSPKRFPSGGQPEEAFAHLIPEPPEQTGGPNEFSNYCINVLGNDPEEFVLVDFLLQDVSIPRQF